jgi:Domain of unknown function (DUF4424)
MTGLTRIAALGLALAMPEMALANDSAAAIGLGGLTLVPSNAISMDSEDLYISQDEVRVRYRFTNRSRRDIETLVSFPVPSLPGGVPGYLGDQELPDYRQLAFRTTIDGRPAKLALVERAEIGGRDVTARVKALRWPLRWFASYPDSASFVDRLSAAAKAQYQREGLLKPNPDDASSIIPAWNLVTHVTRRQRFPAGRSVEVAHSYRPYAGGSVAGGLEKGVRKEEWFAERVRRHCIDSDFFAGFDRRVGDDPNRRPMAGEIWIDYILSSGANWRGPIGDFRLVVDKGKADNLVSFCMDGVRKISPTQFEVRKRNFEPRRDLEVLIVEFTMPE